MVELLCHKKELIFQLIFKEVATTLIGVDRVREWSEESGDSYINQTTSGVIRGENPHIFRFCPQLGEKRSSKNFQQGSAPPIK